VEGLHFGSYIIIPRSWIGKMTPRVKYLFVESYGYDDEAAVKALKSTYKID
jgi:hypothetical protein